MVEMASVKLNPIGYVKNDFEKQVPQGYEESLSEIILWPELEEGLFNIEENSHIVVIFWMDRIKEDDKKLKLHPKGRKDLPLTGVFATRSPHRPNPMGIRSVRLITRDRNVLTVRGLDALDSSPVLDIKPYSLKHDLVEGAESPPWIKKLRDDYK
jgi:tRNA-Thr(GGU) m(6)t(6)A37 methyltransferase TsaA